MNKELELWNFAVSKLTRNEPVVLMVVAASAGSSPGRQGFKMIVSENDLRGSVGGGVMEVRLVERARLQITDHKLQTGAKIVEQVHRKNAPQSSGMICSGRQTVIFFQLNPPHLSDVEKIIRALENDRFCRLIISDFRFQVSDSPPEGGNQNEDFRFERTGEGAFIYEENLGFRSKLFIVGGGHCALALSEIMSRLDFRIALFDDRADLNTLAKNEFAHEKTVVESYEKIGDFIPPGANVYVVVMTLGYRFDEIVIRKLFDKDFKYFGVLGSAAKMKTLLKTLEKEGFDKNRLNKIRTPVGLKINSRTPEEIAVSIAAEIIAVKNKNSPRTKPNFHENQL
ncbi:MAG TPA: XdhC family protein [Pyrinomonadaceae bacterium]|jgi:xanthine dehydrogenase accessory factor